MAENINTSPEPGNNANNDNIQGEITGVAEEEYSRTVPKPEEEKIQMEDIDIMSEMNTSNRLLTETENEEVSEVSERTNKQ